MGEVSHILMDAGLIVFATASNLNDEELRLLQEVTNRSQFFIVNVGTNEFREGIVDLNLNAKDPVAKNAKKILTLLETEKVLLASS